MAMTDTRHKYNLKRWMMRAHSLDTPNGKIIPCGECGIELTEETVTIGHWPVPAYLGGTWTRNNVRPECFECNAGEGSAMSRLPAKLVWEIVYERATGFIYLEKMKRLGLTPIKVSPNFGKVHRKAVKMGKGWAAMPKHTPYRPRMWRISGECLEEKAEGNPVFQ
ncbi:HNH endonuclease [Mycobacterium phage Bombitas]|uniref:HNH endonuclease n=2 Tax=unclassified Omegavirus TaxID=2233782 RepID=UPI000387E934|nr:HNH endonuclease [Mycobacterium phage Wanda]YP_009124106.1 HNH endonuclease [Mycobacterium phage Minerva]AGT11857.1 HNH endonuclease [Mycobacterium phage Wanda]AIK69362.1 HNH endonuclease [Mycobacterium phage Minerva]WNM72698.1 HNH endonuclease [Mycobacterium phage Bombitas]